MWYIYCCFGILFSRILAALANRNVILFLKVTNDGKTGSVGIFFTARSCCVSADVLRAATKPALAIIIVIAFRLTIIVPRCAARRFVVRWFHLLLRGPRRPGSHWQIAGKARRLPNDHGKAQLTNGRKCIICHLC